ncbi:hypothetical protein GF325_12590 [Candidatus Bathyarchaeota archaeon]|nr:hypothetical protein [Candidatus Bathyarchaeota archaeon]
MQLDREPTTALIEKAHQQVHRATFLVENIRNLEKVDALDPVLNSIDAIPIIRKRIERISQMMEKFIHRKVTIHEQLHKKRIFVRGDKMLGEVFENILNNTIVHNRNESVEIIVRSRDSRLNGRPAVIFEILDNGIGVPDQLKHEIFSRALSKGKPLAGTGIGLLLATKIIELYGGNITVDNRIKGEPSKGTKFSITLHAFGE